MFFMATKRTKKPKIYQDTTTKPVSTTITTKLPRYGQYVYKRNNMDRTRTLRWSKFEDWRQPTVDYDSGIRKTGLNRQCLQWIRQCRKSVRQRIYCLDSGRRSKWYDNDYLGATATMEIQGKLTTYGYAAPRKSTSWSGHAANDLLGGRWLPSPRGHRWTEGPGLVERKAENHQLDNF